jgi:hypothetical protein
MFWQAAVIIFKSTGHNNTAINLSKCTTLQERAGVFEDREHEM